ncbi:nuclear transport factor 2 family protein [Shewanella sp. SM34]|uniref:nuclear transport factor 2 family protein n=1 Tax=unclassified Shewanella TaxID=196818 RepID=UPI0021D8618D|nr:MULTISPECIES: nuclear transport factor 2 family protein [unclassified Shewanella]MCU8059088.1 nuclear transport factor 2 family protein [Shewanella sp. SM35]MCU8068009.1 nuclear transport factor 2 family protein [Shewanella sp. SM34]MCU8075769.1 nuclear transport factor 2 family protein [Shewanella sp. SM29]MCU8085305.1 nuclear transport factor 2 family protein [Shewanella sp. SM23]
MEVNNSILDSVPQTVLDYVNGWVQRNADLIVSSMADEATYIDKPHPVILKSGMKDHLEKVAWVNFPDMTFDTMKLFGCSSTNNYAWEWALHASKCGVIVWQASDRSIYCEGVDILTLNSEGKIVQSVCHIDRKALWDSVVS